MGRPEPVVIGLSSAQFRAFDTLNRMDPTKGPGVFLSPFGPKP